MLTVLIKGGFDFVPDVVVSGINDGENLGTDLLYSGTAAVARQAGLAEIPGLAFSLHHNSRKSREWERAARWSIENFDLLLSLWQKNIFVNVNYPNTPDFSDWCFTYPSFREYEDMMQIAVQADGTKTARLRGGKAIRREQKLKALAHPVLKGGTGGGLPSGAAMEKSRLPIISDWDAIIENKVSVSLVCNHPVIMPFAAE
jgi:5'-nucleotidase